MSRAHVFASLLLALGLCSAASSALAQPALPPSQAAPDSTPSAADGPAKEADTELAKPARAVETRARDPQKSSARKAVAESSPPSDPQIVLGGEQTHEEPVPSAPAAPHKQYFNVGLAFVGAVVKSPGFDPYSRDNSLPAVAIFGSATPWDSRPFSLRLAFEWNYASSSASARGNPSTLEMHRLSLGLEGRYLPISRMALFVRAMPSAIHLGGTIEDAYLHSTLESGSWTWGMDLTGGAAARVGAVGDSERPKVSFWIGLDMGYRFAGLAAMRFRPGGLTEADQGRHFGEVPLPNLDLSGFVGRLSASVSF